MWFSCRALSRRGLKVHVWITVLYLRIQKMVAIKHPSKPLITSAYYTTLVLLPSATKIPGFHPEVSVTARNPLKNNLRLKKGFEISILDLTCLGLPILLIPLRILVGGVIGV